MRSDLTACPERAAMTNTAAACADQVVESSAASCTVPVSLEFHETGQREDGA